MLHALNLRREVGAHTAALNQLMQHHPKRPRFREYVGHQRVEMLVGLLVGLGSALLLHTPSHSAAVSLTPSTR